MPTDIPLRRNTKKRFQNLPVLETLFDYVTADYAPSVTILFRL